MWDELKGQGLKELKNNISGVEFGAVMIKLEVKVKGEERQ